MKHVKLLAGAMMVALATTANAADIENTYTINLEETSQFGHAFSKNTRKGDSFLDIYNFSFRSVSDFDTALTSMASKKNYDLNLTSFDLYSGSTLIAKGNPIVSGELDVWSLSSYGIAAGNYSLQVAGTVLGSLGGSYGGNANVSPIPEPGTWAMYGVGIAALGLMLRRRKTTAAPSLG